MNALIPLLSAQATIEKLRADIAKSLSEQAKAGVPVPTSDLPTLPNGMTGGTAIVVRPTTNAQPAATPAPTARASSGTTGDLHQVAQGHAGAMRLVTINVFDQKCLAIVDVSGRRIQVGEGDSVEGGWTVTAISDRTVTVARGRETLTLRM
ncbi:hypothetical protein AB4Y43_16985 [Paraburkholderia sp. BR10872]|uniref:hypothetical protein n=1 Tax=Paraburkholderia sp. BR10872 TaxID=3236989 RepID=UPI0034D25615